MCRETGRGALGTLLAALICATVSSAQVAPPFHHGASMHDLMNWGTLRAGAPGRYATAPFQDRTHTVPDALFRNAARAGFDFIRLTVDPGPFLQLSGAPRAALDRTLLRTVARLRGSGLAVLVDIHPVEQVPAYDGDVLAASLTSPAFASYRALVGHMAGLLGGLHSADVGFELMNEPPNGYDAASAAGWQSMLESLHATARAQAPDLLLVLSGAQGGDPAGLETLDPSPFRGSNVLYTFHYYEPHDFTHQGVQGEGEHGGYRRYLGGLPYPSDRLSAMADRIERNVTADPTLTAAARRRLADQARAKVAAYQAGGYDRARVKRDFDAVAAWAASHQIPADRILLGEFGVARRLPG